MFGQHNTHKRRHTNVKYYQDIEKKPENILFELFF